MRTFRLVIALAVVPAALSAQSLDFGTAPAADPSPAPEMAPAPANLPPEAFTPGGGDPGVVPEPSTVLLVASGLVGVLGAAARRRFQK